MHIEAGKMDPLCGLNKIPCAESSCQVNSDGTYNGLCCEQLGVVKDFMLKSCHCFTGYSGEYCERTNNDEMLEALASIKVMSDKSALNVTIFGIFLGVMALTLSAIVLFVVVRMSRKKKVVVMEEAAEPCSPQGPNAPNSELRDRPENVIVVKRGNSVMRYSTLTPSCCHHPTDPNGCDASQLPLSPTPSANQCISPQAPTPSANQCTSPQAPIPSANQCTSPQVNTKHDTPASPSSHSYQDEIDVSKSSTQQNVKNNSNEYIVAIDEAVG